MFYLYFFTTHKTKEMFQTTLELSKIWISYQWRLEILMIVMKLTFDTLLFKTCAAFVKKFADFSFKWVLNEEWSLYFTHLNLLTFSSRLAMCFVTNADKRAKYNFSSNFAKFEFLQTAPINTTVLPVSIAFLPVGFPNSRGNNPPQSRR
jgi:hypothetical protein